MKYRQEHLNRLLKTIRHGHISKTYSKKAVIYGRKIEVYEFERPRVTFKRDTEIETSRRTTGTRTKSSVSRARTLLFRLVEGNVRKHGDFLPVFVTLTFRANLQDLEKANYIYKKFIKRLNYYLDTNLKYVTVPEWQKRGAIHYHTVFFNLPFIDKHKLESIWGQGMTNIQLVKKVKSMGAYLAKYFGKSADDPRLFGKRAYMCSRYLLRPLELYGGNEVDEALGHATIKTKVETNYNDIKHTTYEVY